MSSTSDARRVRRFFAGHIAPTAERLQARGVSFFPLGPTPEESWYAPPPEGADFQRLDPARLEAALAAQWRDCPELAALAPALCALARSLEHREEDGEVSPFVYVMY
ncbi:MAG TPA: hypothetical protein VMW19_21890 [Myxococcota bacterium]|nr:hypothetical protein [Myxococcota bacterium]